LTVDRFIPHPFSLTPGARLYRTGDRARYRADGNLEFLGRLDDQVKIRGVRIELGEIRSELAQHPAVREVAVLAREDVAGGKRLVAYVVLKSGWTVATDEWRAFLRKKLPDYMVPSVMVVLEALPITASGKVDHRALPLPDQFQRETTRAFTAPNSPIERKLADIWSEVLGQQPVGIHDDFFALGGHSLLATQVVARACEAFQVHLSIRALFEEPTIARLAERIETIRSGGRAPADSKADASEDYVQGIV
jgi:acyl carrier protein